IFFIFFFQAEDGIRDRNVTGVQTCALPIYIKAGDDHDDIGHVRQDVAQHDPPVRGAKAARGSHVVERARREHDAPHLACRGGPEDRKSTRLNSSHVSISYAVFCLKKKNCSMPASPRKRRKWHRLRLRLHRLRWWLRRLRRRRMSRHPGGGLGIGTRGGASAAWSII